MMTPERCAIIDGSKARSRRTAGIRFWSSSFDHCVSSSAANPPPGGLDLPQVAPGTDRALRDVVQRNEAQRGDGVLVARLGRGIASRERLLEECLERGASIEGGERDHTDRLDRMALRFPDELVPEVFTGERKDPAVVVLDDLVLPEKSRRAAEHGAAEDQVLADQVLE